MLLTLLLSACAPVSEPELLLSPDPSVSEPVPYGLRGPHGAAVVEARAQARVSDAIPLDILYPAEADGSPAVTGAPVVVFIHGGLVPPDRYHWLPAYLATRGWVSVLPQADLQLAITEPGNGQIALDRLQELSDGSDALRDLVGPDQPVVTMGHSLGGVMAAGQWATDADVDAFVLLASFPADFQPIEEGVGPALALTGTTDEFDWANLEAQLARVAGPTMDARIQGMNHYAWTDDATDAELDSDGPQTRSVEATRADALRVLDTWLDVRLFGADGALLDGPFPGVEVP
jgi:pimeloyl-ACP methyl ester carboxylesterase